MAWIAARWSALAARWIALAAMALDFALAISLIPRVMPGIIDQRLPWVPSLGITYHLSMDGLSLLLILLTGLLGMISVACSWREITERVGLFHLTMLLLLSGIIGVFLAYDLILFYLFWELMLIPMYILIALWGHENRVHAAIKFFLFTFISGLLMLISILGVYSVTGAHSFDLTALAGAAIPIKYALPLMLGFFAAFAVKLPAFGVHTWLPDAHTEAPTAGSVILAGLMLKTGAYGSCASPSPSSPPPRSRSEPSPWRSGSRASSTAPCWPSPKPISSAWSPTPASATWDSCSWASIPATRSRSRAPSSRSSPTAYPPARCSRSRACSRNEPTPATSTSLGGLWETTPKLGGFTLLFALAAVGLPGLGNFVGEFLVLLGMYQVSPVFAILGSLGFILSVIYGLRLVHLSMQGPNIHDWRVPDLSARETVMLGILAIFIAWLGLYPTPIFRNARQSVETVQNVLKPGYKVEIIR